MDDGDRNDAAMIDQTPAGAAAEAWRIDAMVAGLHYPPIEAFADSRIETAARTILRARRRFQALPVATACPARCAADTQ
jgi:hypothetical protein